MKQFTRKLWIVLVLLWMSVSASAYDFTVDGNYYNVVSLTDMTCSITSGDEKYSGDFVIPETVIETVSL